MVSSCSIINSLLTAMLLGDLEAFLFKAEIVLKMGKFEMLEVIIAAASVWSLRRHT